LTPVAWKVTEAFFVGAQEMTLTIDHGDGTQSFVVVPILRMTERLRKPTGSGGRSLLRI